MKLFLHQARHEIRQIGGGLLVWTLAGSYLTFIAPRAGRELPESLSTMMLTLVCVMLVMLFGGALVAKSVQLDAPDDSTVFWRTRPLSVGRLLGVKLAVLIGVFVILPCVAALLTGSKSTATVAGSGRFFLSLLALVLASAAIGSVTKDLGRYLLVIVVGFFASVFVQSSYLFSAGGGAARFQARSIGAAGNAVGFFVVLMSLAVLVCQYRFRRPWLSYALVVAGFAGVILLPRLGFR